MPIQRLHTESRYSEIVVHHGPVTEVVTAENLSSLYETPARVVEVEGRRVVLWE